MATIAVHSAMTIDGKNHLHPFFWKNAGKNTEAEISEPSETSHNTEDEQSDRVENGTKRAKRGKKAQDTRQKTIFQGFKLEPPAPSVEENAEPIDSANIVDLEEEDLNKRPAKKRKTVSPGPNFQPDGGWNEQDSEEALNGLSWHKQLELEASKATKGKAIDYMDTDRAKQPSTAASEIGQKLDVRPARIIQLKNGKLASPKKDGNGRKNGNQASPKQLVVKVKYSTNIAERIHNILEGKKFTAPKLETLKKPEAPLAEKSAGPPKPTHPFFMGKSVRVEDVEKAQSETVPRAQIKADSPRKTATTPGKIRAQRDAFRAAAASHPRAVAAPAFARAPKDAGMKYPAWPSKDDVHVRGLASPSSEPIGDIQLERFTARSLKRRRAEANVHQAENVLYTYAKRIRSSEGSALRIPTRLVTTGIEIQEQVFPKLSSSQISSAHPALLSMFSAIEKELTPFDKFECETQAWTQKYSPRSANEVLQNGSEARVLRDWLQRSTISAVQTSSKRSTASSTMSSARISKVKPKAKRKRADELEGFLVDSDDNDYNSDNELKDLDCDVNRSRSKFERSLVRGGTNPGSSPCSAVLLSGPSGCGKTAAVYAVAKELGFEVFELNSASRRNGKDVIDKIGDMTENHLVQQVSKALDEDKASVDAKPQAVKIEDPDVPDTKQRSMAAFFKPSDAKKIITPKPLPKAIAKAKEVTNPSHTKQKQSLILFEEVDVLFEEDKQFWLTILTLAAHSKRPIIMTCNNESFVPLDALTLHALLRFTPAPINLVTDYLLLLAAREGHLLERTAIESLYNSTKHDLRASIMELNFWCQMAVGDPTRGFHWLLERYPPGSDVDEHGRTLRVSSQDTYVRGMGVVSHDLELSLKLADDAPFSLWNQAWDDWDIDPSNSVVEPTSNPAPGNLSNAEKLRLWEFTTDIASAVDFSCGFSMRDYNKRPVDHSVPDLTDKLRTSYILGLSHNPMVLQTDVIPDYTKVDEQLAISAHVGVSRLLSYKSEQCVCKESAAEQIVSIIEDKRVRSELKERLSRADFHCVLEPLAEDPESKELLGSTFLASSIDREFSIIPVDLAPYIRTIAAQKMRRDEEHIRMSNLVSAGGERRTRPRTTRSAINAIEGGTRGDRYRARYFERLGKMGVDCEGIMNTGGKGWTTATENEGMESTRIGTTGMGRRGSVRTVVDSEDDE